MLDQVSLNPVNSAGPRRIQQCLDPVGVDGVGQPVLLLASIYALRVGSRVDVRPAFTSSGVSAFAVVRPVPPTWLLGWLLG